MKIEAILKDAYRCHASDLHLIPGCPVMLRVDGRLCPVTGNLAFSASNSEAGEMPAGESEAETLAGKCGAWVVQGTDMEEFLGGLLTGAQKERLQREGSILLAADLGENRFRIHIYRQRGEYAAVIRLLWQKIPAPEELGIPEALRALAREERGLVLVAGEGGSGRSLTLASLLQLAAGQEAKNIVTIENPVEYLIPHGLGLVSQREIGTDAPGFGAAAQDAARQDADVVFFGEIPDEETAEAALAAAEAGSLVLASLCACRASEALEGLAGKFAADRRPQALARLAGILKGVAVQRLLPASGGRRIALFEVMPATGEIPRLIREDRMGQISSVMEDKMEEGMQGMDDAILAAYTRSRISAETAVSCANDPGRMKDRLRVYR